VGLAKRAGAARGAGGVDGAARGAGRIDEAACGTGVVDGVARGAGGVNGATRGAGRIDGATHGTGMIDVATRGAGGVDWAVRGAEMGMSCGVVAARGEGNGARRGGGGGGNRVGLEEGVKFDGWGRACKGKHIFVEDDLTRDDDAVGGEVQAPIPLVVREVAEEEAASGARRKLVRGGSGNVRVAGTAEHAQVVVGRGYAVQGVVRCTVAHRLRGKTVEEMHGGMKGLCLVGGTERCLKEKAADHVGGGANHALGPVVLSRGVETRETQLDTVSEEERAGGVVVELAAIVALQGTDQAPELGGYLGEEVSEGGKCIGLQPKGESPKEMGVVI
jgi:hypothetical protein